MKKLSVLIALIHFLLTPFIAYGYSNNDFIYYIQNGSVKIVKGNENVTDLVIPSEIDGYPVTEIADEAFYQHKTLTSVHIPASVTKIGSNAFSLTPNLVNATAAPECSAQFSDNPFWATPFEENDSNYQDGLLYVGNMLISSKHSPDSGKLKESTTSFAPAALQRWHEKPQNLVIPENVTHLPNIFGRNSAIRTITLPKGLVSIDKNVFSPLENLRTIYYGGTQEDWKQIDIGTGNERLDKANIFYTDWNPTAQHIILTIGEKRASVFGETVINDVAPKLVEGRTMLPIRFVAEALGARVLWEEHTPDRVKIYKEGTTIHFTIGESVVQVNGVNFTLETPVFIENNRTYLPVRFVAEHLNTTVSWDGVNQRITIIP